MALVVGTNCGFVTVAPTTDPGGTANAAIDGNAYVFEDTTPAKINRITEIGWYCNNATEESNYEVGIYDSTTSSIIGSISRTNAKGTVAGWKRVKVDMTIEESTTYDIAVQVDDTATTTNTDETTGGAAEWTAATTLPTTWSGATINKILAFYAVVDNVNVQGPATHNEKEIKTDWPVVEGTVAGVTKQTGEKYLKPEESSLVLSRNKSLL